MCVAHLCVCVCVCVCVARVRAFVRARVSVLLAFVQLYSAHRRGIVYAPGRQDRRIWYTPKIDARQTHSFTGATAGTRELPGPPLMYDVLEVMRVDVRVFVRACAYGSAMQSMLP